MAKTKLEKIANIEEEINQLNARKKELLQQHNEQERKARNHRLCKRGGLWESLLPDTITLTDDQFKTYLEKTLLTEYARKILRELNAQNAAAAAPQTAETAARDIPTPTDKPAETARESGEDEDTDEGNGARRSG